MGALAPEARPLPDTDAFGCMAETHPGCWRVQCVFARFDQFDCLGHHRGLVAATQAIWLVCHCTGAGVRAFCLWDGWARKAPSLQCPRWHHVFASRGPCMAVASMSMALLRNACPRCEATFSSMSI